MVLPSLTALPQFFTPRPVRPAAAAPTAPRGPMGAWLAMPGQRLGNAAPLASPSLGVVLSPTTAIFAALAGVRATRAAGKTA